MRVLIVEDELLAREYLENLLSKTTYEIEICGGVDSVKSGISWFLSNPEPDLVFMDINLGDGICFEIFEVVHVSCPLIFTTAYDQYAIRAFKQNSIDYLLKPVNLRDLNNALDKYSRLSRKNTPKNPRDLESMLAREYKRRFIVKIGNRLITIAVEDISYFTSRDKSTYAVTNAGRSYPVDYTIEKLGTLLDPIDHFKVNRKYILSYASIGEMVAYSNSRVKVALLQGKDEVIVARERVEMFKEWLDR